MSPSPRGAAAAPLAAHAFAALMRDLGPFESRPRLAVGVSGGGDSLALALLLHDWAAARGGDILAFTVDHGLRPESATEARRVRDLLAVRGIAHRSLRWRGAKPMASPQAAARAARHALLARACAQQGILHLVLAHHLDDQAETLLLRLGRGSGLDGLAAMASLAAAPDLRLLRPLLGVPKARLLATLRQRDVPWIEDPSNDDAAFARVRLRALAPLLAAEGLSATRLAATAGHLGRARGAVEQAVSGLLTMAAELHPAGFLWLEADVLAAAPPEVGLRALARCLMTVGGADFTPRLQRLQALYRRVCAGLDRAATLGGCRLVPRHRRLLLVREAGRTAAANLRRGETLLWDGRYRLRRSDRGPAELRLAVLGNAGWRALCAADPGFRRHPMPAPARAALPALFDDCGLLSVPPLGYRRSGSPAAADLKCRFEPKNALTCPTFTVV